MENEIIALRGEEFLSTSLPKREFVINPCIPSQGLVMIYASRGIGKTYFALLLASKIITGENLDRWKVPKSRRVLYIDGEMPANLMQERIDSLHIAEKYLNNLSIITRDIQKKGQVPNIADPKDQELLSNIIEQFDVIIIDNLSTLARGIRENEADSWTPVQEWALSLRARGKTVIFIHHANKSDKQRGTSRREDVLDTVIKLKHPIDYKSEEGARFEVHFEKTRSFSGLDAEPFELRLIVENGKANWQFSEIIDLELQQVVEMSTKGVTQRVIATKLGISLAKVNRLLNNSRY